MVYPLSMYLFADLNADQTVNQQSNEPHRPAPTHGGDYDPNERTNMSNSQRNNTKASDNWLPGPTHGGDYDPNQFDASHMPGHQYGHQYDPPSTASESWRQAPSGQASFYNPNSTTKSSNPAGPHLDVGPSFHYVARISCLHC